MLTLQGIFSPSSSSSALRIRDLRPIHLHGESANGGGGVQGDAERVRPQQRPRAAAVHLLPRQAYRGHLAHGRGGVRERVLLRRRDPVVAGGDDAVRAAAADGGAGRHAHPARGVRGLPPRHRAPVHGRDLPPAHPQLQQLQPRGGAVPRRHRRRRARLHPQPPRRGHVQPHGPAHHAHDPEPRVHAPEQQRAAGHAVRAHARIRLCARASASASARRGSRQARSAGASAGGEGFEGSSLFCSSACTFACSCRSCC